MAPDTIIEIDPNAVERGERIGLYWHDKAAALGALMARDGQNDPIKVRPGRKGGKPFILVAGLHRLEGAKRADLATVKAIIVEGDELQLRLIEASENMHRRDFGPIEKALFVRALADVYEAQFRAAHPEGTQQQIAARARWEAEKDRVQHSAETLASLEAENAGETISHAYGWVQTTAEALGMTSRSLRDYLLIHRQIIAPLPDHYEDLARHPIGQKRKSVMELAEIGDLDNRRAVIDCLLEYPLGLTIAQAKEIVGIREAKLGQSPLPKGPVDRVFSNLNRWSSNDWTSAAPQIAAAVPDKALDAICDALLAERKARQGGQK
ncbi:ParB/RepB/Spo0J family partition protein [Blastomonas natatoria]|uniref:ParB/RepB/Spo0J family partition protein n=1 Tax=Blastomonas natatoria TaxID=34015 RepID=A0A2V3VG56_9SPHN|nr:ParB N-terminal domain-containing protein [Blastomonas natatoria]PXW79025.1 ParB/RepB/Spo0J family partition protein [Blastomonas natatoria]